MNGIVKKGIQPAKEKPSPDLQPLKEDEKNRQFSRETQLSGLMKEIDQVAGKRGKLQLGISLQVTNYPPDNDRRFKKIHLLKKIHLRPRMHKRKKHNEHILTDLLPSRIRVATRRYKRCYPP